MAPFNYPNISAEKAKSIASSVEIVKESTKTESEQIIERINEKINYLYRILESVCCENHTTETMQNEKMSSKLTRSLEMIEERITDLLNIIKP